MKIGIQVETNVTDTTMALQRQDQFTNAAKEYKSQQKQATNERTQINKIDPRCIKTNKKHKV